MTNGSMPSQAGSGFTISSMSLVLFIIGKAYGNSSDFQEHLAPKAEGSVHIPYSDQNPGKNIASGKVSIAFIFESNHICSFE